MRGQSHVVGVALLLGISVVALGSLTVVVGSLVDAGTASANAMRVADEMDGALRPVETTGHRTPEPQGQPQLRETQRSRTDQNHEAGKTGRTGYQRPETSVPSQNCRAYIYRAVVNRQT